MNDQTKYWQREDKDNWMSKQIDEAVASGTHKYVSSKLHAKLYQVTNLLLVALRPAWTRRWRQAAPALRWRLLRAPGTL